VVPKWKNGWVMRWLCNVDENEEMTCMEREVERGMRGSFCKQLNRLAIIHSDQARFETMQSNREKLGAYRELGRVGHGW
jgi:hypothetical protein